MSKDAPRYTQGNAMSVAGYCYLQALKFLSGETAAQKDDRDFLILPMDMLAGFALELFLKAYLLNKGETEKSVRALSHNLDKSLEKCKELGLDSISGLDELVSGLGRGHQDFTYRYANSGDDVPEVLWDRVIPILDNLKTAVGKSNSFPK